MVKIRPKSNSQSPVTNQAVVVGTDAQLRPSRSVVDSRCPTSRHAEPDAPARPWRPTVAPTPRPPSEHRATTVCRRPPNRRHRPTHLARAAAERTREPTAAVSPAGDTDHRHPSGPRRRRGERIGHSVRHHEVVGQGAPPLTGRTGSELRVRCQSRRMRTWGNRHLRVAGRRRQQPGRSPPMMLSVFASWVRRTSNRQPAGGNSVGGRCHR